MKTLVIPQSKIGDVAALRRAVKRIGERLKIEFVEDLAWKWR